MYRHAFAVSILIATVGCGVTPPPTLAGGKPIHHWVEAVKSSPDPKVRKEAVFKLGNVGATDPEALPALVSALQDRDPRVRCETIIALVKFGSSAREVLPRLTELRQRDPDARVRTHATRAIERLQAMANLESASASSDEAAVRGR